VSGHKLRGKALVLGDDTRAFLSVIRSLGRGGVEVHVAWCPPASPALRSRYIAKVHDLPSYAVSGSDWQGGLSRLLKAEHFDLVLPCSDPIIIPLHEHRKELERLAPLYLLDDEAYEVVTDKIRTNELARAVGVPVPPEIITRRPEDADTILKAFPLPVVLKPRASFQGKNLYQKHRVRKVYRPAELQPRLEEMLRESGPVAVQQNFIGQGVGVELLLKAGRPLLAFQHVRLHEPLHGGGSSYRMSVPVQPHLLEASLKLLRPLRYTGVAMVEFKVNPRTGACVLVEVNGRFWGSLPLAVAAGADFPLALFRMLVHGQETFPQSYRVGLCARNLRHDLRWFANNLRADRSDPTLATRPMLDALSESAWNIVTMRDCLDTLTPDDPAPGLTEIRQVAGASRAALTARLRQKWLQSGWARRRYQERARRAVAAAPSVLFLCKGNICRSPFAEQLARTLLPSAALVRSAGYFPHAGRPCPAHAVAAARRWGVDLASHRSRQVTEAMLRDAAAILVFDDDNHQWVAEHCPQAKDRTFFLGGLNPSGPVYIDDPEGADLEVFGRVYQAIAEALWTAAPARGAARDAG
jgi:protein-tyrosine-phosphatase/predicted ATP-grasp superfamily ATP-dependent carboligase